MGMRPELEIYVLNSEENAGTISILKERTKKYYYSDFFGLSLSTSLEFIHEISRYPDKLPRGSYAVDRATDSLFKLNLTSGITTKIQEQIAEIERTFKEEYSRACLFEFSYLAKIVQTIQRSRISNRERIIDTWNNAESPIVKFNFPGWVPDLNSHNLTQSEKYAFDDFVSKFGYGECKLLLKDRTLENKTLAQLKEEIISEYDTFAWKIDLSGGITSG